MPAAVLPAVASPARDRDTRRVRAHDLPSREPKLLARPAVAFVAVMTLVMLAWSPARAQTPTTTIKAIDIVGNTKTRDETVLLIASVAVGQSFHLGMIDRMRADLVDSGLFKSVDITYAPDPSGSGGVILFITAEDKHSWIIAPTYYDQPTNRGGGLGYGENNLFGENKKLLVYGQLATGDSFFVAGYIDPAIRGSRFHWQADVYLKRERSIEYVPPDSFFDEPTEARLSKLNYLNAGVLGGANLFRGASAAVRLRGARVFYDDVTLADGIDIGDVTGNPAMTELPDPGAEGYDVSAELRLEYDRRANWYGISHGNRYRVYLGQALTFLGSDFSYQYAILDFQRARRYFDSHNLVLNARVAHGRDLPFQQEFLAGGTALRGYKNNQFRGDSQAAVSAEYSFQALSVKGVSLRLLGFLDSTYTTFLDTDDTDVQRHYLPGHDRLGLAPLKNTVGVGTRLCVRQIVLPLLGLDLGYGIERRAFEIYLAIGLTDI
jgi:outer membrane protein insertion porin family